MPETEKQGVDWDEAIAQVNRWRGDCLQSFAQSETAVTETLILLNSIAERGSSVKLRHLIGQRFEDLASAAGPDGPFAEEGAKTHRAITAFLANEKLRAFLCHGVAKIALERSGSWIAIFNLTTLRAQKCDRTQLVITQEDAQAKLQEIKNSGNKLGAALGNLRKQLAQ